MDFIFILGFFLMAVAS